ncbi:MAG: hypothetical protein IJW55_09335 [Clostridia bacterium]|nr:hypothetical protein [Clostridia bacterium]
MKEQKSNFPLARLQDLLRDPSLASSVGFAPFILHSAKLRLHAAQQKFCSVPLSLGGAPLRMTHRRNVGANNGIVRDTTARPLCIFDEHKTSMRHPERNERPEKAA